MALAGHLVVMNNGRIEDQGTPERVYAHPSTRFAATFMGESTILEGDVAPNGTVTSALGPHQITTTPPTGKVMLAIRPEHVTLDGAIPGIVQDVVYQGSFKRVMCRPAAAPQIEVLCRIPSDTIVSVGDEVKLGLPASKLIVLKG